MENDSQVIKKYEKIKHIKLSNYKILNYNFSNQEELSINYDDADNKFNDFLFLKIYINGIDETLKFKIIDFDHNIKIKAKKLINDNAEINCKLILTA